MPIAHALPSLLAAAALLVPTARIVAEWDPGVDERELGGELVVDDYGITGLGAYVVRLDDGSTVRAVCIEADVGHSLAAEYVLDDRLALPPELDYLAWAYLRPGIAPTDEQAAAVNALAWRYTDAQRRGGGAVWQGDELEVRVLGVGRLTAVERAVAALHAEATARRGPWALTASAGGPGVVTVRLAGPGGPIGGVGVRLSAAGGWSQDVVTDRAGTATATVPAAATSVLATATAPGDAVALVAPGSQRLATPGPATLVSATVLLAPPPTTTIVPPPTTTTVPPTTTTTTTTTTPPTTTTTTMTTPTAPATTTTAPATTTTTTALTTTTTSTVPPTTVPDVTTTSIPSAAVPPPTLPPTGSSRTVGRLAALLFALGAGAVLAATPRPPVRRRPAGR